MFTDVEGLPTVTADQTTGGAPRFLPFRSLIDDFTADATRRKTLADSGQKFGAVSGFPELDEILGGCLEVGLYIVHGSPGAAKTAFALQVGAQCECICLYVTCEMTGLELLRRHSARINETYLGKYKRGKMSPESVRADAIRAAAAAPNLILLDATENTALPSHIFNAAQDARDYAATNGFDNPHLLIILDSVHTWSDTVLENTPEYDRLNAAVGTLRKMAKTLNCSIIGIAERNRVSIKAGEGGSGQNSSAGSRKFEYSAEAVIGLDSSGEEFDIGRGTRGEKPITARTITATVSKNRHGKSGGKVEFEFCGAFQEFKEVKSL